MKRLFLIFMMFCVSIGVWAQTEVEFTADRPGASTGPAVVGHNVIQLEQGLQYDGGGGAGIFTISNTLLRYGLFPNMELRLSGDAFIYQNAEGDVRQWLPAFSGLSIGTKIKCFDGEGAIPAVSVLAEFSISGTATKDFQVDHLAPSLYLLFENPVCDWLSIGYNVGAEWDGSEAAPIAFAALCFGFSVADSFGCFVESYNYFGRSGNQYAVDFGMNWQVARKLQLDISANIDLVNPTECWAISCGLTWQINR